MRFLALLFVVILGGCSTVIPPKVNFGRDNLRISNSGYGVEKRTQEQDIQRMTDWLHRNLRFGNE